MLLLLILFGFFSVGASFYIVFRNHKQTKIITSADQAHMILKSIDYTRHQSNAWLVNTLSIVNPFTVNDASLLETFKKKLITVLTSWTNEKKYEELISVIENRITHRLSVSQSDGSTVSLSKLIKQVTLDAFLSSILNVNATEELLTELPELVIHLWKHRDDKTAQHRLQELFLANKDQFSHSEIWQGIQTILSNHSNAISKIASNGFDEKISNPLNIIVPGWETMWRVVFYSLLELLRHTELQKELRLQLKDQTKSYRDCALLEWILKETLRLYPPTKNIYRTNIKNGQEVCISVQQIHHNTSVWGSDAHTFRPNRFQTELTAEQKQHYLPFSISCPARHKFAYTFAGVLVAEILKHCPALSIVERCSLPSDSNLLDIARNSYDDLLIIV